LQKGKTFNFLAENINSGNFPKVAHHNKSQMIRVAGVPEHFNEPWRLAVERGLLKNVEFVQIPEGTGRLVEGLKAGKWDVVIALTEGLVKDIAAEKSDIRIFGTYVQSPLCWAVSSGANSEIKNIDQLRGKKIGISRFTSGSHLMACVMAAQKGWNHSEDLEFVVNHNFKRMLFCYLKMMDS
jgi:ABC-type nitrate/sulfonate/bicarbonate transport system substrate-binding protein